MDCGEGWGGGGMRNREMLFQMEKWVLPGTGVLKQKSGICGGVKRGTVELNVAYSISDISHHDRVYIQVV